MPNTTCNECQEGRMHNFGEPAKRAVLDADVARQINLGCTVGTVG